MASPNFICPPIRESLHGFSMRCDGTSFALLSRISVLTARMGTLIHPKPFRVNQIVLRRIIFQLGSPSARFALTCNRLELVVPRRFSDTTPPLIPLFAPRLRCTRRASASWDRQCPDPSERRADQASGLMALRQQRPVAQRMLN